MLIGYARTSTLDQTAGFEAQLTELKQSGCEKVFSEQVSSVAPRGNRQGEERGQIQGTRANSTGEGRRGVCATERGCWRDGDREETEDRESQRLSRTDGSRS